MRHNQYPNITRAATVVALLSAAACGGKEASNTHPTTPRATSSSPAPLRHPSSEAPTITPSPASTQQATPEQSFSQPTRHISITKLDLTVNLCQSGAVTKAVKNVLNTIKLNCDPTERSDNQGVTVEVFRFTDSSDDTKYADIDVITFDGESAAKDEYTNPQAFQGDRVSVGDTRCWSDPVNSQFTCLVGDNNNPAGITALDIPSSMATPDQNATIMRTVLQEVGR